MYGPLRIHIHDADQFPAGNVCDDFQNIAHGVCGQFRRWVVLKSLRCISKQFQCLRGFPYCGAVKVCGFNNDVFCVFRYRCGFPAFDAGDSYRRICVAVRNEYCPFRKRVFLAGKHGNFFSLLCISYFNLQVSVFRFEFSRVKRVHGLANIQHHVIRCINDIVYGALADRFKRVL